MGDGFSDLKVARDLVSDDILYSWSHIYYYTPVLTANRLTSCYVEVEMLIQVSGA